MRHAYFVGIDFIRVARKLIVTGGTDIMAREMKEEKWEKGGGNPAKETAVSRVREQRVRMLTFFGCRR